MCQLVLVPLLIPPTKHRTSTRSCCNFYKVVVSPAHHRYQYFLDNILNVISLVEFLSYKLLTIYQDSKCLLHTYFMHGSDNLHYKQAQAVYDQICTRYVVNSSRLRLQSTALKAVGIVNLLLKFFKTVTDIHLKQVTVQQQMKEIHFWRQKCVCFKTPQCIRTSTSRTTRTLFVPIKLLGDCKEFDL